MYTSLPSQNQPPATVSMTVQTKESDPVRKIAVLPATDQVIEPVALLDQVQDAVPNPVSLIAKCVPITDEMNAQTEQHEVAYSVSDTSQVAQIDTELENLHSKRSLHEQLQQQVVERANSVRASTAAEDEKTVIPSSFPDPQASALVPTGTDTPAPTETSLTKAELPTVDTVSVHRGRPVTGAAAKRLETARLTKQMSEAEAQLAAAQSMLEELLLSKDEDPQVSHVPTVESVRKYLSAQKKQATNTDTSKKGSSGMGPDTSIWRPWNVLRYPPASFSWPWLPPADSVSERVKKIEQATNDELENKFKVKKKTAATPTSSAKGRVMYPVDWSFTHQHRDGRTEDELAFEKQAAAAYTVIANLCVMKLPPPPCDGGDAEGSVTWCEFLEFQCMEVALVGCLVISQDYPLGRFQFYTPFAERIPTRIHKSLSHEILPFAHLNTLLQRATSVYVFDSLKFYGLLRAAPVHTDVLQQFTPTPSRPIEDPFRPKQGDMYDDVMYVGVECKVGAPQEKDAEDIKHPSKQTDADPTETKTTNTVGVVVTDEPARPDPYRNKKDEEEVWWKKTPPTRFIGFASARQSSKEAALMSYDVLPSASEENAIEEAVEESSVEISADDRSIWAPLKPGPPYFREQSLVFWGMKTRALVQDLRLWNVPFCTLVENNSEQKWFVSEQFNMRNKVRNDVIPVTDRHKDAVMSPRRDAILSMWCRTHMWSDVQQALIWELRLLADMCTNLYEGPVRHRAQALVECRRRWFLRRIAISAPGLLSAPRHATSMVPPRIRRAQQRTAHQAPRLLQSAPRTSAPSSFSSYSTARKSKTVPTSELPPVRPSLLRPS